MVAGVQRTQLCCGLSIDRDDDPLARHCPSDRSARVVRRSRMPIRSRPTTVARVDTYGGPASLNVASPVSGPARDRLDASAPSTPTTRAATKSPRVPKPLATTSRRPEGRCRHCRPGDANRSRGLERHKGRSATVSVVRSATRHGDDARSFGPERVRDPVMLGEQLHRRHVDHNVRWDASHDQRSRDRRQSPCDRSTAWRDRGPACALTRGSLLARRDCLDHVAALGDGQAVDVRQPPGGGVGLVQAIGVDERPGPG